MKVLTAKSLVANFFLYLKVWLAENGGMKQVLHEFYEFFLVHRAQLLVGSHVAHLLALLLLAPGHVPSVLSDGGRELAFLRHEV